MEENKQEIVTVPNGTLADITDDIIASAERRIESVEKIINLALKITNTNDWVDQQGKPYLTGSGAEKVARLFGVCWSNIKTEKISTEDEKGKFYFYQTSGVFSLQNGNDKVEAIGTCSSKDQFFAKVKGELKPISQIDETNIMKSSYTNCITNGITRLLGMRNLTWDQVKGAGIDRGKVSSVKYASGGAGGGVISEPQRKRLHAILMQGSEDEKDRQQRQNAIKDYMKKELKITSSQDINRKDYDKVCEKAQEIASTAVAESV